MQVRSDRRYFFDVDAGALWGALGRIDEYRRWWPWLRRLDAEGLVRGDVWRCSVQPPLPYVLRFEVTLDEVVDRELVVATVSGDIEGTATLVVHEDGAGTCEARLTSELAPRSSVLRAIAQVAAPVVRFGHDWVLDTGFRQFQSRAFG